MPFNITIGSDHSSISDEEDSSGVRGSPLSDSGSHVYQDPYDEWAHLPYPDELKPSDSASRPRTTGRTRMRAMDRMPASGSMRRHAPRRHYVQDREPLPRRSRRPPSPESPESEDSGEEYTGPYDRPSQDRRFWPPVSQGPAYAHTSSPGPPYTYPHETVPHGPFGHPNGAHPPSDQLVRVGHHNGVNQQSPYGHPLYPYNNQFHHHPPGAPISPFFVQDSPGHFGRHAHHPQAAHTRSSVQSPPPQALSHPIPSNGPHFYGGAPLNSHDLVPYGQNGYYPFREPYPMAPGMIQPYYGNYPRAPSPSREESSPSPPPAPPADAAKDEAIARLEKLILEERSEREAREAREAARQAEIEKEAAEQAAREERAAHEKQIAEEAAAAARAEAEQKAAEEAAKAKQEAEEAAAAAAAEAALAATEAANAAAAEAIAAAQAEAANQQPPPEDKKKPIKFKDAIGRKFSFPFELCCTWQGMEELIRQAFLHIEVIGPHVADGHYDLVGPNGDIILPQIWDTVIEPDWSITMHMWPIPEKPKTPEPPPAPEAPADPEPAPEPPAAPEPDPEPAPEPAPEPEPEPAPEPEPPAAPEVEEAVPASEEPKKIGAKKQRQKDPGAFAMWVVGGHRMKSNKGWKVVRKAE
ncbi:hypothetical protein SI65_07528 [Aspergillus cristatus]|uniref:Ubiquitin-like domain-containing protein n=1 Tax=Aspergillus cristatus TaxID=573508 RepID=A0A1E3B883_ASPCR|nr:hypothetical protein SI65_07528 [Aspergillus cristatus]